MYVRIPLKGIAVLFLITLSVIPARALEERIVLSPGMASVHESATPVAQGKQRAASFGDWLADGAILRRGFRGAPEYAIANQVYKVDSDTDILLHFDESGFREETGAWTVTPGKSSGLDRQRALLGSGSASFRGPDSELLLAPGPHALLARDSRFRDFSIEFWLYPTNAENGEILLLWQSIRKSGKEAQAQELSCIISGGRIAWSFYGFFIPPDSLAKVSGAIAAPVELRAKSPLIPRTWTHHLLRFDGDSGLLEYTVDGVPESMTYVTSTGREGGTVFTPAIGGSSPLRLAPDYSGLIDEFRISRAFVTNPKRKPYGRDPALVLSPVADLGYGHSRLIAIDADARKPGTSDVELSYRIADEASAWRLDEPAWLPLRSGQVLPDDTRGRYVQVRVELYADGTGTLTPSLSSLTLRFEPSPPPPPPTSLVAVAKNNAIELRWNRVPVSDLGGYLVYYGDNSGEYFGAGALEGQSPVDAGQNLSLRLTGLQNGRLYYFVIASYDSAGLPQAGGNPPSRAGEFSTEIAARPSRTAP